MSTTGDPLVCQACPTGSTTQGGTNSQDISACGKNGKLSFQFLDILIFGDGRCLHFKSSKCRINACILLICSLILLKL